MSDIEPPADGMNLTIQEQLDDGNTIGIGGIEPGEGTVTYEEARQEFAHVRKRRGKYEIGDEDSNIFISSEGGELSVGFGPEFAPIETCIKQWQVTTAIGELEGHYPQFTLCFDDRGLVAFRGEKRTVIVAPIVWEWQKPHTQTAPCGPRGPSI